MSSLSFSIGNLVSCIDVYRYFFSHNRAEWATISRMTTRRMRKPDCCNDNSILFSHLTHWTKDSTAAQKFISLRWSSCGNHQQSSPAVAVQKWKYSRCLSYFLPKITVRKKKTHLPVNIDQTEGIWGKIIWSYNSAIILPSSVRISVNAGRGII